MAFIFAGRVKWPNWPRDFRSSILCRLEGKVADARSIISILILCAGLGATLEIEASGPDEREAIQAIDAFFSSNDDPSRK